MGSETDKLFRDKLKSLEQTPPPTAWSRVEKNVRKPRSYIMWLNIAAAMLILILGIWNQWPDTNSEVTTPDFADTLSVDPNSEQEISNPDIAATPAIVEQKKIELPITVIKRQLTKRHQVPGEINQPLVGTSVPETQEEVIIASNQTELQLKGASENVVADQAPELHSGSTTFVYTSDEVNTRFLKKPISKKSPSPPPVPAHKPNTGQKITSIAVAIKNNEVGLGDLRQFKDELLAFDFLDNDHKNPHTQDK